MKGIIMAGGEGTRLRPLTCDCPKPMLRLMGRPVMAWTLGLLKRHGVEDIAVTLGYMPDAVTDHFGDGSEQGVRLRYYVERTPLGTAGGVGQARDFLDETFIVLSGDGVTDLDITRALAFHMHRGALATLVLVRSENPMDYGMVDVDAEGRVRFFHEKPDWSEVLTDTVNTGIYILEPEVLDRIPEGKPCDFGHELFPKMVAEGLPVYGCVTQDYWCDIGDVKAYLQAHADAMEGRIRLDGLPPMNGRAVQLPGAMVDRAAVLQGPCLIEDGAKVCAGAHVGPYSVIGENCVVGEGASVKRSVLWPGARLAANAQARGCILASGATLGEGAQAYEGSVLGASAAVGDRGVVLSGVKLWPGKRVAEGERLAANRVWGGETELGFIAGALPLDDPADAARAVQACMVSMKPREALLGHDGTPMGEALWHAVAAGCIAQGVRVIDAGACTLPLLRHAQGDLRADAALFVRADGLVPLNAFGARLTDRVRREITRLNARQDYPRPPLDDLLPMLRAECAGTCYVADVARRFTADPCAAVPVALHSGNPLLLALARQVFDRIGLIYRTVERETDLVPAPEEIGLMLSADGECCIFSDENGMLTEAQHQLTLAWIALERGETELLLPDSATRGIESLLEPYGARAEYLAGEPARWMDALARQHPLQLQLHFDGLILAVSVLSLLAEQGMRLDDWRRAMPEVHRRSRSLSLPRKQNGRVLRAFAEARPDAQREGGVRFERQDGWAWVGAQEDRSCLRIVTEAASAETAAELCDICERELKSLCDEI